MNREHLINLAYAKQLLETPSLAVRLSSYLGKPIEQGLNKLPGGLGKGVQRATELALRRALDVALFTLDDRPRGLSADRAHTLMVATTGAVGGAFGVAALSLELPVSTGVMLRSIADIARSEGESLRQLETKLACLEVFAFGGYSGGDDAADAGYFAVRAALSHTLGDALQHIAERGLATNGAPVIVRLIGALSARFGVVVSEKLAAQALPVVGAVGGALVNAVFMEHFQCMARGHFIVRRLERTYGAETVERAYASL